jgi:hypothetical protein
VARRIDRVFNPLDDSDQHPAGRAADRRPERIRRHRMRAIVQDRYGSAPVLRPAEIDRPGVGADDVLLRVRAASLNIGDWHLMAGLPYLVRPAVGLRAPKTRVRGMDVAGRVEAVGANVTRFSPGDEVFGICEGSLAEYASARADRLEPKPAAVSFEQAAAVPTSAVTALQGLAPLRTAGPGERVLIIGASGAVGGYAVQIARSLGAHVTGAPGRPAHARGDARTRRDPARHRPGVPPRRVGNGDGPSHRRQHPGQGRRHTLTLVECDVHWRCSEIAMCC